MKADEARDRLHRAGLQIASEERLRNNTGLQIRLPNGGIVNVFDKGTLNVQGKNIDDVQLHSATDCQATFQRPMPRRRRKCFVVYGHDQPARDQLQAMLRLWGLVYFPVKNSF